MKNNLLILLCASSLLFACKSMSKMPAPSLPIFETHNSRHYADSLLDTLNTEERISQLFMLDVHPTKGEAHLAQMEELIKSFKPGGIVIFKSDFKDLTRTINRLQAASEQPLLVAIDGEWGLNMRVPQVHRFPYNMTLGAIEDDQLIFQMGKLMGLQLKQAGVHINFAPVVDINNNPNNPVIGFRSFSDNKHNVARKGIAYMKGLQESGILAVAKHFPGHGNTNVDSHKGLPIISQSKDSVLNFELSPFRELIKAGVGGVMVGHLSVPALDSTGVPASLSKAMMRQLLKNEMGFKGLVFSDAMNMGGIVHNYEQGEKLAIQAGMDVIEYPFDTEFAIQDIKQALDSNEFDLEEINKSLRKVLMLKHWTGAYLRNKVSHTPASYFNTKIDSLNRLLYSASTTLLKKNSKLLPLKKTDHVAFLLMGSNPAKFEKILKTYSPNVRVLDAQRTTAAQLTTLSKQYDKIVLSLHNSPLRLTKKQPIKNSDLELITKALDLPNTLYSFYSNPYLLNKIPRIETATCIIQAYQESPQAYKAVLDILFGKKQAKGKLPFQVSSHFPYGMGVK